MGDSSLLKFKAVLCTELLRTPNFFGYMLVFVDMAYTAFQTKLTVPNKNCVEFSYHQIKKSKQAITRKHVN